MYNEYFGFSESPFKVTPDPRFFFVNSCYEEAFATLRYGIDARKGFIVVTGEAGTGKTTLLKRLVHSVEPHVHTACIFDPHLSFVELLRSALTDLGIPSAGADRLTMMEQLYLYLVRQLESDQIVSLMIDEAQNLSGELLEEIRLLSNLETDTQKLIQIILVGQPEFEQRLDQAQLLGLKQRVALRCRLRRLEWHEVGSYIDARLKTARFERRDLFDSECVERIALYSKGIPRVINVICDNALLNAYATSSNRISLKEIDAAAYELKLLDEPRVANQTPVNRWNTTAGARENVFQSGAVSRPTIAPRNDPAPPEFEPPAFVDFGERPYGWQRSETSYTRGAGFLLILLMTVGVLFIFEAQQRQFSFPFASSFIEKLAVFVGERETAQPTGASEVPTQTTNDTASKIVPENSPAASTEGSSEAIAPSSDPDTSKLSEIVQTVKKEPPAKESAETSRNKPPIVKRRPGDDEVRSKRRLEIEIYKAIHDRAIEGVEVSVSDDTVYLDGRVATRQQILAAVRATLSVPGVKNVRNRIVVG